MSENFKLDISWKTFWQIFVFLLVLLVLYQARAAFGVLFIAIVLALGLDPIVSFLEKKRINRMLGTIFIFLLALFILIGVIYLIVPIIILEAGNFLEDLNKVVFQIFGLGLPQDIIKDFSLSLSHALSILTAAHVSIGGAISAVFEKIILVFTVVVISFYLSISKGGTERLLKVILPDVYEPAVITVFSRFKTKIKRWLAAQLGLSLIVGTVVGLGLWLLGVRYALILGILAAVLELVPIIGPIIAGAIAFLVALGESFSLSLYVLAFSFLVQQLENHVLIPVFVGKTLNVHPVIVVVSLLAGAQIAGFVGIVLSVPIAVMAQEIFTYLAEKKDRKPALGI